MNQPHWRDRLEEVDGDGENSFGEAGASRTSAPRDPEPPLFYYSDDFSDEVAPANYLLEFSLGSQNND
ncbi:hypothetical protein TNCV_1682531 [Trichonephila clavipes]|nr:hypothetical protein TNCV_1682531 [Trichonephila clavipes]